MDRFSPIQVECACEVNLPDPAGGDRELVLADGSTRAVAAPSPAPEHCGICQFVGPCLAMERDGDVRGVLEAGFRDRGPDRVEPGRLGAATWGMGRGAAPPRFDSRER